MREIGGGSLSGIFNIPVISCPDGHCISSVGTDKKVNPPCLAGEFLSWEEEDVKDAREKGLDYTHDFLKAMGMHVHPSWHNLCTNNR